MICAAPRRVSWPAAVCRVLCDQPALESLGGQSDITSVYDRYSYDSEKRAATEFWNRQLSAILKGRSAKRVRRFMT